MRLLRHISCAVLSGQLIACASAPASGKAPPPVAAQATMRPPAGAPKGRATLITEEEIAALGGSVTTAMGIVQQLRPSMLRVRAGATSSSSNGSSTTDATSVELVVYFDNQRMGGLQSLNDITVSQIREIRYLSASDATTLFGTGNSAGAIQVVGRR
jgi:hypothetical protein